MKQSAPDSSFIEITLHGPPPPPEKLSEVEQRAFEALRAVLGDSLHTQPTTTTEVSETTTRTCKVTVQK